MKKILLKQKDGMNINILLIIENVTNKKRDYTRQDNFSLPCIMYIFLTV